MADGEQAIVLACSSLIIFYALTDTNPSYSVKLTKLKNVYFNELTNYLHIISVYKLHNKLSCESSLSRSSCRAMLFNKLDSQNEWARHVKRVKLSFLDVTSKVEFGL